MTDTEKLNVLYLERKLEKINKEHEKKVEEIQKQIKQIKDGKFSFP